MNERTYHAFKKSIILITLIMASILSVFARAEMRVESISPNPNLTFPNWSGVGNTTVSATLCIKSTNNLGTPSSYTVSMQGPLQLPGPSGNLPFSGVAIDTVTNNSFPIISNQPTGLMTGNTGGCALGDNLRVTFTLNQADLAQVEAGRYSDRFNLNFINQNGDTDAKQIRITIRIDPWIQLTGMQDLYLGNFMPGQGDIIRTLPLCVFTNSLLYQVTASGNGAGGAFTLQNPSLDTLPYSIRWQDDNAWTLLTANTASINQGSGGRCLTGINNAQLEVTVLSIDMQAATAGSRYAGTLTILLAPI